MANNWVIFLKAPLPKKIGAQVWNFFFKNIISRWQAGQESRWMLRNESGILELVGMKKFAQITELSMKSIKVEYFCLL